MTGKNRSPFWLASLSVAVSMTIFLFVVWHAAITQPTSGDLPVISAPSGSARVAPELPGGMEVPNQKMTVFETFQEDPLKPGDIASAEQEEETAVMKPPEQLPGDQEGVSVSNETDISGRASDPNSSTLEHPKKNESYERLFVAQLGSFGSLEGAEQGWEYLRSRQPDMMEGLTPVISKVDLGEVGIFYRLRTEVMGNRQEVDNFCEIMLKSNVECMVVEP